MTTSIEGIDWRTGAVSLRLENGRVSGTGGINRLMGDYQLSDGLLTVRPLATTLMAGPPDAMESEQAFLE